MKKRTSKQKTPQSKEPRKIKRQSKLIILLSVIILLAIIILILVYFTSKNSLTILCAKAGETAFNDATQKSKQCCQGLNEINGGRINEFGDVVEDPGKICSDCGNGICELWEHIYNCQQDCK